MRSSDQIVEMFRARSGNGYGQELTAQSRMRKISEIYNGNVSVDLPDVNGKKSPPVPNLVAQGIDQIAGRIASVQPSPEFVPTKKLNRREERRAETAGRAISAWWAKDNLPIKMRQRARHLVAYAMSPVTIRWDFKNNRPSWQVRDPLSTYPNPDQRIGESQPSDIIFSYRRSVAWLRRNGYAEHVRAVLGPQQDAEIRPDTPLTVLEYVDPDGITCVLTGVASQPSGTGGMDGSFVPFPTFGGEDVSGKSVTLEYTETPGMTSFVAQRIGLDSPIGQFDNMIEMYHTQGRLAALEVMAVEKGIFPDTYLVSRPGELGKFIDGPYDGRTGQVNIVAGGDVKEMNPQPGYLTNPTIDRLERNQRVSSSIPPEFGGEASTGIRTGRRGDSVLSSTIDHPIGEAQEIFGMSLMYENEAAIRLAKEFDGDNERTFRVGTGNAMSAVTFTANQVFKSEEHDVAYPAIGSDMNSLIMGLGQRVGLGTMSKKSAAKLDPYISDAEFEHDQIIVEGLEMALLGGIQQQAAGGQLPPKVLARLIQLVGSDKEEIAEAMNTIMEEAAAEQQAAAEAQQAGQQPDPAGLGAGAAQQAVAGEQMSPIPGASAGQEDLGSLLLALRQPGMGQQPGLAPGTM